MNYEESKKFQDWETEKRIADEIKNQIKILNLPLVLDDLTRGRGDCWPVAVLQQCRRPEILSSLPPHIQQFAQKIDQWKFRIYVARFATGQGVDPRVRNSPRILAMKKHYESTKEKDQSWSEYWDSLIKKRQWVCEIFVECTALLLQHDIHIISTSSTPDQPWLVISGKGILKTRMFPVRDCLF